MLRLLLLPLLVVGLTATPAIQQKQNKPAAARQKAEEPDAEEAQQRTVAISRVTALPDEAKTFKDQTRRARVQTRAADVLRDSDPDKSRELFQRAWEAAVIVDVESVRQRIAERKKLEDSGGPVVLRGGNDLRAEVLRLVAKRDRKLGEEFLKAFDEATEKEKEEQASLQRLNSQTGVGASKRLQLARRLLRDGQIEGPLSIQEVWEQIKAAPKLVIASERSRALDLLENALLESRRIGNSDPDRARALTGVAEVLRSSIPSVHGNSCRK